MKDCIGFIGCGNMGGALVRAVSKSVSGSQIALCDYCVEKAENLAKEIGASVGTAEELASTCSFLVLGVKPQNMQETLAPLKDILSKRKILLISMAAGISTTAIQTYAGDLPVIRIMPNTPAMLGKGMILYTCNNVDEKDERLFLQYFDKAGLLDKLDESLIDGASALSGCGPAFVYAFVEALVEGAVEVGVDREKALTYATQTLLGAGEMIQQFGDPASLRKAVCSPNGTTLAGLACMQENGFSKATKSGVLGAYKRTLELKK